MKEKDEVTDDLHRVRAKLYPNRLPHGDGAFVARTENESVLNNRQICSKMVTRGRFSGNFKELLTHIELYLDEIAYQLCDGFGVNTGYFSIHPNIQGTFESSNDEYDRKKNPVDFRYRTNVSLRNKIEKIEVNIAGLADPKAFIRKFLDMDGNPTEMKLVPGKLFCISGRKIKVAGNDAECGVFFVSEDDPSQAVKVMDLAENSSTMIKGIIPDNVKSNSRIEVRTRFTGSAQILLKEPRVIRSDFVLAVA